MPTARARSLRVEMFRPPTLGTAYQSARARRPRPQKARPLRQSCVLQRGHEPSSPPPAARFRRAMYPWPERVPARWARRSNLHRRPPRSEPIAWPPPRSLAGRHPRARRLTPLRVPWNATTRVRLTCLAWPPFREAVQATTIQADTSTETAAYETAVTGLPVATPIVRSVEIANSSSALSDVEPSGVRGSPQPAQPSMEPGTYAGRLVDTFDAPVRTRAMAAGDDIHTPPSEMPLAAGPAQLPAQSPEPESLTTRRMPIAVGARPGTATLGAESSLSGAIAVANASSSARPIVRTPELQRVPAREIAERPSSVVSRSALVDVPHAPVASAFTPEGGRAGTSQAGFANSPLSQVARLGTFGGTPGGRSPVFAGGGPGSRFEALPWAATSAAPVDTGTADAPVARMTARSTATESRQEAAQPETPAQAGPSQGQASGSMAPASAGTPGVAAAGEAEQDVDKLADKVWAIIRQKLHIERERQRGF